MTPAGDPPPQAAGEHAVPARFGGWRLDKPERSANIDAIVALCMAVERAE